MVCQDVILGEAQLEVKDVEELPLDATHIALAENPGAERPVKIL